MEDQKSAQIEKLDKLYSCQICKLVLLFKADVEHHEHRDFKVIAFES